MNLIERDSRYVWHPYTQMQTTPAPIGIVRGEGAYLYAGDGRKYFDAVASWWVNLHGHSHSYIAEKVSEQLRTLEHAMFAGFTHPPAVDLAERLLEVLPSDQAKVFYSDDGSTAVEVAVKMAMQYWSNKGTPRNRLIALKDAYHGDTFGAMSVSSRSTFTAPFSPLLFEVDFIDVPVKGSEEEALEQLRRIMLEREDEIAAFIFEPLVQGTAGMVMYEPGPLDQLLKICREHGILTIADEVMTGFGRTGKLFACNYLEQQPDIFCFSKGITGGTMAFGATTCTQQVFDAFLSGDKLKTFFHGHSFTANPLACAASLASLDILVEPETMESIARISRQHEAFAGKIAGHRSVRQVRCRGTIFALEWETGDSTSYFSGLRDKLYNFFLENGIIMRPLGNIIYIMPPYCSTEEELDFVYQTIELALEKFSA
ncbi:adenosylmethionine--8-amino-7-oxononanoate transaminase [Anseongella ginsenosidimutans]|nr:adenosylmethionine--8-amino-7-oxononanoate transaminase [Anseongella ginsenosidimutans]QEC52923.1 adenosylmethionine--8-amino-7-oxononanoate transaminase [Anseongella ginsenosidimutans]